MKLKRRAGSLLIIIGILLIAAAAVMYTVGIITEKKADRSAEELSQQLVAVIAERAEAEPAADPGGNSSVALENGSAEASFPEDTEELQEREKTINYRNYNWLGYLSVPKLRMEIPILASWSTRLFNVAPCRYSGSPEGDDLVLAGHNYRSHFGRLNKLAVGDEITFTDMDGVVTRYVVAETEVLQPTDIRKMLDTPYALTMFTCTKGGKTRFTVRCNRAE